jgi:hypothetical protein
VMTKAWSPVNVTAGAPIASAATIDSAIFIELPSHIFCVHYCSLQ